MARGVVPGVLPEDNAVQFTVRVLGGNVRLRLADGDVLAEVVGAFVGALGCAELAWPTATLATVGGALGAGLEDDDVVRAAALPRSEP